MSGAETTTTVSIVEKIRGLDFWCQITSSNLYMYVKEDNKTGHERTKPFQPLPIDSRLAEELRPYNGFYNLSSGLLFPVSPFPGPVLDNGFLMIDQSVEYLPNPSHKICVTFKSNFQASTHTPDIVEDITSQIVGPGGFDSTTHTMRWFLESECLHGRAMFMNLPLTAHNPFVTTAQGIFAEMPINGRNQLAPAGLDVFVGDYQHVIFGAPPCTFNITRIQDGFQCIVQPRGRLAGSQSEILAPTISYNSQMYLLTVPDDPQSGLQGFIAMLGTFAPVGLVAYVMGKSGTGFIGINEKPDSHHDIDRLQNSVLCTRILMYNADPGTLKRGKKAEAAKKTQPTSGVPLPPEVAYGMRPFNGFYSLKGSELKDDTVNWLLHRWPGDLYCSLKSPQKGVPQYKAQVTPTATQWL